MVVAGVILAQDRPITGVETAAFSGVDSWVRQYMEKYGFPGGSVAVVRNGKLVYARGFGFQDVDSRTPVQPATLFRIASLSKPITAAAVMKLVEQGRLRLDQRAFEILSDFRGPSGTIADDRARTITIEQLLNHTGGWDIDALGFDPMFQPIETSAELGVPAPAGCSDVIRRMLGRTLSFAPGTRYAYSNFGYCILGRVIEKLTGVTYEQYVREEILAPMGITTMRIGHTLPEGRASGETRYYMPAGAALARSVFPPVGANVPRPYGSWHLEAMDSHGGWIASAPELARFLANVNGQRGMPFLGADAWSRMAAPPAAPVYAGSGNFYGLGWSINPAGGRPNYFHGGGLDGTTTYMVKLNNGVSWVALFNMRPTSAANYISELDSGLNNAVGAALRLLTGDKDEFETFLGEKPLRIADWEGVLEAANFGTFFAPGAWVTIRGANLASGSRSWRADEIVDGRFPNSLDGVRVLFDGKPASVYYVSPTQINVQAPSDLPVRPVQVEVIREGVGRDVRMADVRPNAPGLFAYFAANTTWAAAVHLDGVVAGPESVDGTRVVHPGDRLLLFGNGFGSAPAGSVLDRVIPLTPLPVATLGGVPIEVEFAGYVSAGLLQANVRIPETFARTGDLAIQLRWGTPGISTVEIVKLAVRSR
jgi:uncharacterized protein (TIGR03437 family)